MIHGQELADDEIQTPDTAVNVLVRLMLVELVRARELRAKEAFYRLVFERIEKQVVQSDLSQLLIESIYRERRILRTRK